MSESISVIVAVDCKLQLKSDESDKNVENNNQGNEHKEIHRKFWKRSSFSYDMPARL